MTLGLKFLMTIFFCFIHLDCSIEKNISQKFEVNFFKIKEDI